MVSPRLPSSLFWYRDLFGIAIFRTADHFMPCAKKAHVLHSTSCHHVEPAPSCSSRPNSSTTSTPSHQTSSNNPTHSAMARLGQSVSTRIRQASSIGPRCTISRTPRLADADAERPSPQPAAGPSHFLSVPRCPFTASRHPIRTSPCFMPI